MCEIDLAIGQFTTGVPPAVDETCLSCVLGGRSVREAEAYGLLEREAAGDLEWRAGKEGVRLPTLESPDADDDDDDDAIGDATALAAASRVFCIGTATI